MQPMSRHDHLSLPHSVTMSMWLWLVQPWPSLTPPQTSGSPQVVLSSERPVKELGLTFSTAVPMPGGTIQEA